MPEPITSFRGEFSFLSNFHPAPVVFDGIEYRTVEHAFQAAKTKDLFQRKQIHLCSTPAEAKRLGRRVTLRPDWNSVRDEIMLDLVKQKFQNPRLRKQLISTGSREIIEGNTWGDTYWGAVSEKGEWKGKNVLGKILMRVRENIVTQM